MREYLDSGEELLRSSMISSPLKVGPGPGMPSQRREQQAASLQREV